MTWGTRVQIPAGELLCTSGTFSPFSRAAAAGLALRVFPNEFPPAFLGVRLKGLQALGPLSAAIGG